MESGREGMMDDGGMMEDDGQFSWDRKWEMRFGD